MSTIPESHVEDELDLYALGALDPAVHAQIAAHIDVCTLCQLALSERQKIVEALAWTAPQYDPPADLRDRLLRRIQGQATQQAPAADAARATERAQAIAALPPTIPASARGPRPQLWLRGLAAASLALAVAFGGLSWRLSQELTSSRAAAAQQQQVIATLQANGSRLVRLTDTTAATGSNVRLLLDPSRPQAFLMASDLAALPAGRAYELWLIKDQAANCRRRLPGG